MTVRRLTAEKCAAQREIIEVLRTTGDTPTADRLQRCMSARLARRRGGGWPWTCRSAGCVWCGPAQGMRWWLGIQRWIAANGAPVSLVILPIPHRPCGLRAAVARLRRALRDMRDRAARRRRSWCGVALAGMATGDGVALLLLQHPDIDQGEVAEVLGRRWPGSAVGDVGAVSPAWTLQTEDAVELANARRGVEPLRAVVLAQRTTSVDDRGGGHTSTRTDLDPMPVLL